MARVLTFAAVFAISGSALHAQSAGQPTTGTTTATSPKRAAKIAARDSVTKARAAAAKAERQSLQAQVKAGTITKAQAKQQFAAWQKANRPARKPRP